MGANIRYAHQLNNEKLRIDQMNKQQQINIYNQDRQAASQLLNAGMYNTTSGIQAQLGAGAGAPTSGGNKTAGNKTMGNRAYNAYDPIGVDSPMNADPNNPFSLGYTDNIT